MENTANTLKTNFKSAPVAVKQETDDIAICNTLRQCRAIAAFSLLKHVILAFAIIILAMSLVQTAVAEEEGEEETERQRGAARFEERIAPQYEDAGFFSDGLAAVKEDGKWGYVNINNEVVIPFIYDFASVFSEGYAVVGTFADIAQNGEQTDDEAVDTNERESHDDEIVSSEQADIDDDVYLEQTDIDGDVYLEQTDIDGDVYLGRIDIKGDYIPFSETVYDTATNSYTIQNLCLQIDLPDTARQWRYYGGWVSINGKAFDTNGNRFRTSDDQLYSVSHIPTERLVAAVSDTGRDVLYLDMQGNIALDLTGVRYYDAAGREVTGPDIDWNQVRYDRYIYDALPFNQGLAPAYEFTIDYYTREGFYGIGFIGSDSNWVIPPQFEGYVAYDPDGSHQVFADNGLASVIKDGKYGAIDITGTTVISFIYDYLWPFREGLAAFERDGRHGFVDYDGVEIYMTSSAATSYNYGFSAVYENAGVVLVDRNGNPIPGSDAAYLSLYASVDNTGWVCVSLPGEYITVEEDGVYGFAYLSYDPPLPADSDMDIWAYREVIEAIEANLIPNSLQNQYRSNITRGEYCSLIVTALCELLDVSRDELVEERTGRTLLQHIAGYPFADTVSYDVIAAHALGLAAGYEGGSGIYLFGPHRQISRQEAAVFLWRAAGLLGMDNSAPPESDFEDRGQVPEWAQLQVDYVFSAGIMNGVSDVLFAPGASYSRQQAFVTIARLSLVYNS